jgi:hypothetical protein
VTLYDAMVVSTTDHRPSLSQRNLDEAILLLMLSHNTMHLSSKKTDFLLNGETAGAPRPCAVSDLPSGCPSIAGLVRTSSQQSGPVVDGQFDDAVEVLSEGVASGSSRTKSQANLHETASAVPMTTVVSPSPPLPWSHPTFPAMFLNQPPTSTMFMPLEGQHATIQSLPTSMIPMHPSYFLSPYSNVTASTYIPIAPRPVRPTVWRKLPVKGIGGVPKKKTVLYRKRASSSYDIKEPGTKITSYGTKLLATLHPTQDISAFCRILPEHPNVILIPHTDVSPGQRLPMVQYVERDLRHPVLAPFRTEDVFLGRGGFCNQQRGNLSFRALIAAYRDAYHALPKFGKGQLARNVCNYVRLSGGRFLELRRDNRTAQWYECGDDRAQAKCSQALRETSLVVSDDGEETSAGDSADGSCATV